MKYIVFLTENHPRRGFWDFACAKPGFAQNERCAVWGFLKAIVGYCWGLRAC